MNRPRFDQDREMLDLFRQMRSHDSRITPGFRRLLERETRPRTRPADRLWLSRGLASALTATIAATLWFAGDAYRPPIEPVTPAESLLAPIPIPTPSTIDGPVSEPPAEVTLSTGAVDPPAGVVPSLPLPAPPSIGEPVVEPPVEMALRSESVASQIGIAPPLRTKDGTRSRWGASSGGIGILVMDNQGNPLPAATVTIRHPAGYVKETAQLSNRNGNVVWPVLRETSSNAGYELIVSFPGFATTRITDVEVVRGTIFNLPLRLQPEIQESVVVAGTADIVDLESTKFSDEFIQNLPVPGRFYQNVLTLAPGIVDADGDGNPNVHGSRSRDFKAEVSGVSDVDPLTGQMMSQVDPSSFYPEPYNAEGYAALEENRIHSVAAEPLSTFSIDVDTASYSNVRRFLEQGRLPPADAVRIEELINYFSYDYPEPEGDVPFSAAVEVGACPWQPEHRLARIALRGRSYDRGDSPGSNLVFLIDVSGSMNEPRKLPLLKSAFRLLAGELTGRDRVAIVVYAGAAGVVLQPTSGSDTGAILRALDRLSAGGGTNGGAGLARAYALARDGFIPGGVNRVILATDGDFNLGETSHDRLLGMIERDAKDGIYLTALGFGYGDYQDARLEQLADRANGNYAYIDRLSEARKVLVEQIGGTLYTIAKDVKIQIEFNPLEVGAYRLIGYENRRLNKDEFNDDTKDAGEIGAGHTVTALYELVPPEAGTDSPTVDPLKYQTPNAPSRNASNGELLTVRVRYKDPEAESSRLLSFPVTDPHLDLSAASDDFRFAAAVAQLGMLLRGSEYVGSADYRSTIRLARDGLGVDRRNYRREFLELVRVAARLDADRKRSK